MPSRVHQRIPHEYFLGSPEKVAADLVGSTMHLQTASGQLLRCRIVETEAYLAQNDAASHSAPGRTRRNAPMFEQGGIMYVYRIYGIHHCANIVCEEHGVGSAVLLRAAELLEGEKLVRERRVEVPFHKLLSGPGNLCAGLGLGINDNYRSCVSDTLWFEVGEEASDLRCGERIGITKDANLSLRFFDAGSKAVSAHRRGLPFDRRYRV